MQHSNIRPLDGKFWNQQKGSHHQLTYQDLRHILRDFEKDGLIKCLNPECQTGRFYALTAFEGKISQTSKQLSLCAKVSRAKTRLAVLKEVSKERFFESHPLTATRIKKLMRESYPLGLNHGFGRAQISGRTSLG